MPNTKAQKIPTYRLHAPSQLAVVRLNWVYTPAEHKTEHHGRQRTIYLGPRAQKILLPFLKPGTGTFLFSAQEAEKERYAKALSHRRPNQKPNKRKTKRETRDHYDVDSYRRAIERGCDAAFPLPPSLAPPETANETTCTTQPTTRGHTIGPSSSEYPIWLNVRHLVPAM